ncbi:MAG: anti-sigma factor family protein [Gemmatimonadales bacterium]
MEPLDRFKCEEVFQRLDAYLDRELSEDEMRLVREHLEACARCASEHQFEMVVLDEVRRKLRRISVPEGLVAKVSALLAGERRRGSEA